MKKNKNLVVLGMIMLATLFISSCQKDESETQQDAVIFDRSVNVLTTDETLVVDLIAGQTMDAGDLVLSFDDTYLYVTFSTQNSWLLDELHLWVGHSLSEMPKTNTGNPKIGLFPYKVNLDNEEYYQFMIPLSDYFEGDEYCGSSLFVAAHASVVKYENGILVGSETAWGEGTRITNKGSWGMYFSFTFNCIEVEPEEECETAFGYGSQTFIDAEIGNRWGWIITLDSDGNYNVPLYAGAGQNDITKGTHVGNLELNLVGQTLTARYVMFNGYTMSETHLYASSVFPSVTSPGQYGNLHSLAGVSSDEFVIQLSNSRPVYVIAHAVVCN
jgi:hypothetical protein